MTKKYNNKYNNKYNKKSNKRINLKEGGFIKYDGPIDTVNHLFLNKDGINKHKQNLNYNKDIYDKNVINYGSKYKLIKEQNRYDNEKIRENKRIQFINEKDIINKYLNSFLLSIRCGIKDLWITLKHIINGVSDKTYDFIAKHIPKIYNKTFLATARSAGTGAREVGVNTARGVGRITEFAGNTVNWATDRIENFGTLIASLKYPIGKVIFLFLSIIILLLIIVLLLSLLFGWLSDTFNLDFLPKMDLPDMNPFLNMNLPSINSKSFSLDTHLFNNNIDINFPDYYNKFKEGTDDTIDFVKNPVNYTIASIKSTPTYLYDSIVPPDSYNNFSKSYNSVIGSIQRTFGYPTMIDKNNIKRDISDKGRSDDIYFMDVNKIIDKKILTDETVPVKDVSISIVKPKNIIWELPYNNYKNSDINKLPDSILNLKNGVDNMSLNDKNKIVIPWKDTNNGDYNLSCDDAYYQNSISKEKANILLNDKEDNSKCLYNKSIKLNKVNTPSIRNYNETDLSKFNKI